MLNDKLKQIGNKKICTIAILMRDGKILTGYRNYTKDKWKIISVWTNPGGRCNQGEQVEQALRREVLEEVGISQFEITDFIGEVAGAKEGDTLLIFFGTTHQDAKLMEPDKFSEWRWVDKDVYIADDSYGGFNSEARKVIVDFLRKK